VNVTPAQAVLDICAQLDCSCVAAGLHCQVKTCSAKLHAEFRQLAGTGPASGPDTLATIWDVIRCGCNHMAACPDVLPPCRHTLVQRVRRRFIDETFAAVAASASRLRMCGLRHPSEARGPIALDQYRPLPEMKAPPMTNAAILAAMGLLIDYPDRVGRDYTKATIDDVPEKLREWARNELVTLMQEGRAEAFIFKKKPGA
jgi:hypothetical protein